MNPRTILRQYSNSELLGVGWFLALLILFLALGSQIDLDFVNDYVERAGVWAPIVFILAKASTIVLSPLSGTPLYVLVGTLFGLKEGIIYAFIGDLLGFSILFFVSRKYGMRIIQRVTSEKGLQVVATIQSHTSDVWSFVRAYLIFFWFPEGVIAAAGLGRLSYAMVMVTFMPIYSIVAGVVILLGTIVLR